MSEQTEQTFCLLLPLTDKTQTTPTPAIVHVYGKRETLMALSVSLGESVLSRVKVGSRRQLTVSNNTFRRDRESTLHFNDARAWLRQSIIKHL